MGFKLNHYDMCVTNKIIEGSQCTVTFYVDDNKINHKNPKFVDSIIDALEKEFGNITYSRGKKLDFLGMDIVYNNNQTVSKRMKKQNEEAIEWYRYKIPPKTTTPATKNFIYSGPKG